MSNTQNTYVGDGSTVLYSFTFPYISGADVKVSLNQLDTTDFTLSNATTVEFNTAPSNGVTILIYRDTPSETISSVFFPGSAIRAQDLNDNFQQSLYVVQESQSVLENSDAASVINTANEALVAADQAEATANAIAGTADAALTTASAAEAIANTASVNATTAQNTAIEAQNTANSIEATAVAANSTANAAQATADAATVAIDTLRVNVVQNVAAIPTSPTDGDPVRVSDSTGIESFSPLDGLPAGFVGDSGINVELRFTSAGSTWNYLSYTPNDPDNRYEGPKVVAMARTINTNSEGNPTIDFQLNVASIIRQSKGVYPVTFTNALADTNYVVTANCVDIYTSTNNAGPGACVSELTTTGFVLRIYRSGGLNDIDANFTVTVP